MLDESPDTLIHAAIESFETAPDIESLSKIAANVKKTQELRDSKIDALEQEVRNLEAQLAEIKAGLEILSQPSAATAEILAGFGKQDVVQEDSIFKMMNAKSVELDNLKMSLARQLTEHESQLNQININKLNLIRRRDDLRAQNDRALANNVAANFNSSSMKISLYKSLGVHIEDFASDRDRIVLFDKKTNQPSVLNVSEKYSDFFISNYIWDRLGERN